MVETIVLNVFRTLALRPCSLLTIIFICYRGPGKQLSCSGRGDNRLHQTLEFLRGEQLGGSASLLPLHLTPQV